MRQARSEDSIDSRNFLSPEGFYENYACERWQS